MRLTREGLRDRAAWEQAGIHLPTYDIVQSSRKAQESPRWIHFGIGNIFRIFIGGIADTLLEKGLLDRGITCVETYDYDVVDKIYRPFDNLVLSVVLNNDGSRDNSVIGSLAEAVKGNPSFPQDWERLKEVFRSPDLQLVSFTITEKGYSVVRPDGTLLPFVEKDIKNGPEHSSCAMTVLTAMLLERYRAGETPIALVSMDNCSQNGARLRNSVITVAEGWEKKGYVDKGFLAYVQDEKKVAFPWTMIDRITPRPSKSIANDLQKMGVENMMPVTTQKRTYIAPFVNAEKIQYLVIEDSFPNGRPELEQGYGVYLTDRKTVDLSEKMKVTACLNPVHSAVGPIGVLLGQEFFANMLNQDPEIMKFAKVVEYKEDLPVVKTPGIINPRVFADELFNIRFVNEYLGDTNIRLCADESQGIAIRFGETIKKYVSRYGSADRLIGIPLGLAGWLRYLLGVDDNGRRYELSPDPVAEELSVKFASIRPGDPSTVGDLLKPVLADEGLYGVNLYSAGLGEKVETMFREMLAGNGSVRKTVHKYMEMIPDEALKGV